MEASMKIAQKQEVFPFAEFLTKRQEGWLYSLPVSKKPFSEPVREEFSRAIDGKIVRRWRTDINEPFRYEVFPGYIDFSFVGITISAKRIKELLEKEDVLIGDDADTFISGLRAAFSFSRSEIENDLKKCPTHCFLGVHPLVAYLRVKPSNDLINTIGYFINWVFSSKKNKLKAFVARHEETIMTVKVIRQFRIVRE